MRTDRRPTFAGLGTILIEVFVVMAGLGGRGYRRQLEGPLEAT